MAAWRSTRRIVAVIAGTQSGKTCFGPWWLAREIARCGGGDYLVVTATYDLLKLKLLPEMMAVFGQWLKHDGWQWSASDRLFISPLRKARIILRSAEAEGGLESATATAAWLDECGQDRFGWDAWLAVMRRLSLRRGRVLLTTTPYNLGWLKSEIFDRWRAGDAAIEVVKFRSIDNPAFPAAEYEAARERMPGWKFRMFYDGEFARPAGLVFDCFDEAENIAEPFHISPAWPRRVGIDFGGVHTAMVWLAEDPVTGIHWVYRESLEGGLSTREHVARALDLATPERVVCWAGGAPSEDQQRRDWATEGIRVRRPRIADVAAGIDRVYGMIKARRLRVFRSCPGLIDEFARYSRRLGRDGAVQDEIEHKSTYHRLDALRYVVSMLTDGERHVASFQG